MAITTRLSPYDVKGAEEKRKRREADLAKCKTITEEIALKQVWALEDLPGKMPQPVVHHDGGGLGIFGLFGLF